MSNINCQVASEKELSDLKTKFNEWSGFSFKSDNLEDALKEINSMRYTLECEIYDYAKLLRNKAKKAFKEK